VKVLVIDDEPQIRRALKSGLELSGNQVTVAANGEEGLNLAAMQPPDVVILDLAMPGMDGLAVCKQLREWTHVPIIVLSVRESEEDKIAALDLGADDYLTKPFGMGELLARIRAVMRRTANDSEAESTISHDGLVIDCLRRVVTLNGKEIHLTPKEYDLLRYMASNAGKVLTHRQILSKVWGPEYSDDHQILRVHVANLRSKVESCPERPQFIHTETRIGYRFQTRKEDSD
jgi:two-component system KDP operon response regulator KdpE